MPAPDSSSPSPAYSPLAAVLAWIWPGLGHMSLGQRRRGLLIMAGVLFLYVTGILIGGVDVVDRRRDRLWFIAQSFCGPVAFATDLVNQRFVDRIPQGWDKSAWSRQYSDGDDDARAVLSGTSLGKVNEIGTLYVALAGLMNLVVILDALHGAPRRGAARRGEADASADGATT